MFNLIVSHFEDNFWHEIVAGIMVPKDYQRIMLSPAWTAEPIRKQFRPAGQPDWERLAELPCLFWDSYGRHASRGRITKIAPQEAGRVVLEVALEITVDPNYIEDHHHELGISNARRLNINDWSVKDKRLLIPPEAEIKRPGSVRRPGGDLFKLPRYEDINPKLVSVMMPFDLELNDVYTHLQQAAKEAGLLCRRADNFWEKAAIIDDIATLIDRARVVICDCTGKNPNVFYEMGISHALGRETIIITQNEADMPFDIHHLRYIPYENNETGLSKLQEEIKERLKEIVKKQDTPPERQQYRLVSYPIAIWGR